MSPLTPIELCSSKAGGLSEFDDVDDDDECVEEAEEQAVELDKFLLTSFVINSAAASISAFMITSTKFNLVSTMEDGKRMSVIMFLYDEVPILILLSLN